MSKISFKPKSGQRFRFTDEERAHLESLSDTTVGILAESDSDNPPLTDARLRRMQVAREVRRVREATGLSQPQFAARYRIGLGRLRDFEQARSEPDLLVRVIYRLIQNDPHAAEALIDQVARDSMASAV